MTRRYRSALALALLLTLPVALSACGGGNSRSASIPPEPESPEAAICRQEARDSPEIRRLAREFNADNAANVLRVGEERRVAEIRAYRDCMRRRGATLPGGVEPERRF